MAIVFLHKDIQEKHFPYFIVTCNIVLPYCFYVSAAENRGVLHVKLLPFSDWEQLREVMLASRRNSNYNAYEAETIF